jgi:hypothetical protein
MAIMFLSVGIAAASGIQMSVPALQVAARGDPFVFAMALADAAVPAGIILSESARQRPSGTPPRSPDRQINVSIEQLALTFNESHDLYRASLMDGVLVVAPASGLATDLFRSSGIGATNVIGVMNALRRAFSGLDPALGAPGGIIGSYVNADAVERGESVPIVFDGTQRRIIDCLNAIARQANTTWIVVTSDEQPQPKIVKVGIIHAGGAGSFVDVQTPHPR